MRILYLVLSIVGAVVPYVFYIGYFSDAGWSMEIWIDAFFGTLAASGAASNLLIASLVFWIVMFQQWRRRKGPSPLVFIVVNLLIGLSCALPAYLYVREGRSEAA